MSTSRDRQGELPTNAVANFTFGGQVASDTSDPHVVPVVGGRRKGKTQNATAATNRGVSDAATQAAT